MAGEFYEVDAEKEFMVVEYPDKVETGEFQLVWEWEF